MVQVNAPAQVVLYLEWLLNDSPRWVPFNGVAFAFGQSNATAKLQYQAMTRHAGGANWVLCDGHAKWYRPETVEAVTNSGRSIGAGKQITFNALAQ
jgi:prepilin-type processing-associated H-X9-DG protein